MERLERYCDNGFTDAGVTEIRIKDTSSATEFDELCPELFGELVVWKKKKPS